MEPDTRHAAVTTLVALASSADARDRADAGRCLASFCDVAAARAVLGKLVLDADDTFVTVETAEALLRRRDVTGLAILAAGAAAAEFEQVDWLYAAVHSVLGVLERDRDAAVVICQALCEDPDQGDQVRTGAARLLAMLAELQPVLLTRSPGCGQQLR
jgi:hypothetical protein